MIIAIDGFSEADNIKEISRLGIDWIGLDFVADSPRRVRQLASLSGMLPDSPLLECAGLAPGSRLMGVFRDEMPQTIVTSIYNFHLDLVRLEGEESTVLIDNLRRTATPATPASHEEPFVQETEDVHIVGQTKFQGHQAVILDLDGDAQPDVAVIDVNDNNQLDDQDVLIFRDGTTMTRGELAQSMSEDETGDVTPQTEHQPDHTEDYMQTAYEGAEPDGTTDGTTDGYDGMTDGYDGAQEDPYLHQASYSEDINTANDEGMMDPNLQQASYSEDPAMGYDDPNLGVDGVDDAGTDMQYI